MTDTARFRTFSERAWQAADELVSSRLAEDYDRFWSAAQQAADRDLFGWTRGGDDIAAYFEQMRPIVERHTGQTGEDADRLSGDIGTKARCMIEAEDEQERRNAFHGVADSTPWPEINARATLARLPYGRVTTDGALDALAVLGTTDPDELLGLLVRPDLADERQARQAIAQVCHIDLAAPRLTQQVAYRNNPAGRLYETFSWTVDDTGVAGPGLLSAVADAMSDAELIDVAGAAVVECDNCLADIYWHDWDGTVGGPEWVHSRTGGPECHRDDGTLDGGLATPPEAWLQPRRVAAVVRGEALRRAPRHGPLELPDVTDDRTVTVAANVGAALGVDIAELYDRFAAYERRQLDVAARQGDIDRAEVPTTVDGDLPVDVVLDSLDQHPDELLHGTLWLASTAIPTAVVRWLIEAEGARRRPGEQVETVWPEPASPRARKAAIGAVAAEAGISRVKAANVVDHGDLRHVPAGRVAHVVALGEQYATFDRPAPASLVARMLMADARVVDVAVSEVSGSVWVFCGDGTELRLSDWSQVDGPAGAVATGLSAGCPDPLRVARATLRAGLGG